ncbi:MAG: DAK2 domain-containing protein [Chloroflexi bacterium]|nr:DAK2 domain-containing protein [Chloroflexota bacterium]
MTTPTAATSAAARDRTRATGADLREALLSSSAWLDANADRVNALNVFPVPDGDTGTNMSMTLQAAAEALLKLPETSSTGEVARAAFEASMLGARGNSGVILSQLLKGFATALGDTTELRADSLAQAFEQASESAYSAVGRPVEGTILTVARAAGQAARAAAQDGADLPSLLVHTLRGATEAVAQTPTQLEVLRKAGVVDAGGEGYRVVIEGAWMFSTGRSRQEFKRSESAPPHSRALLENIEAEEGSSLGFCTEFLLRDSDVSPADVKGRMEALGDSVLAVGDQALLRIHVHTLRPGQALEFAVDHGTLARVKVENMQLQREQFASSGSAESNGQPVGSIGVIAVTSGEGLTRVFRSLGALIVHGGQTMNPSVQDILSAVNSSGYKELVLLPNNGNVVLTARQVQELTPHKVAVVPTESAPQGIGALLAFNFQADMQTNVMAMQQAAHAVRTVEITRAVRDAEVDGHYVAAGQSLGIFDGKVVATSDGAEAALLAALDKAPLAEMEIVTIYFGAEASEADAQAVASQIREAHPGLDVEVVPGGQPHYPYVVSLE